MHAAASAAARRFGVNVALGPELAINGKGPRRRVLLRARNPPSGTERGEPLLTATPSTLLVEAVDAGVVLGRARIALVHSPTGQMRQLRRALPSLCEQLAYCLTTDTSLPDRSGSLTFDIESIRPASRANELTRRARLAPYARDWSVAIVDRSLTSLFTSEAAPTATVMQVSPPFGSVFWADPFVIGDMDGQCWLFVESMNRWSGKGAIICGRLEGRTIVDIRTVLRTDHAAFPRVARVGDQYLATVESLSASNPVYTFQAVGDPWQPYASWRLPPHVADPVLHVVENGSLRLFGTDRTVCSAGAVVMFESTGVTNPWRRSSVPYMYDVVAGRSGGGVIEDKRVTQDCSGSYGWRVHRTPVAGLDSSLDSQVLDPSMLVGANNPVGMHTLNGLPGGPSVIDVWRHRADLRALAWRLTERKALRTAAR